MTDAVAEFPEPVDEAAALDSTIGTRQPFDLSDEMAARVDELGMADAVRQIEDEGYTVFESGTALEFTERLRETCIRSAQETEGGAKGRSAALLLGRDPIYEDVVLNPRIQALVEIMCGKGALISQLIASVRQQGAEALRLHADQNWHPAPFPVHNQLLTFCWVMDEYTQAGGSTKVIPGTHRRRRHPTEEEREAQTGAIPIETSPGSIAVWNGSVWHGSYPRQLEGERVVLHITFGRLANRTVENYDHLDEEWLAGKPDELRTMLGRDDFLGTTTIARGYTDYTKLQKTFDWAKT